MKKEEKLFRELFGICQDFLNLKNFTIIVDFELDKENIDGMLKDCKYTHLFATVSFPKNMIYAIRDIKSVSRLIIHELSHIYTNASFPGIEDNKEEICYMMGEKQYITMQNLSIDTQEMMTDFLCKKMADMFIKTKEFKEISKKIKSSLK